jgi:hypothetical protein
MPAARLPPRSQLDREQDSDHVHEAARTRAPGRIARMHEISERRRFEISTWVNDQLEGPSAPEIPKPHRDLDDYPSWRSDPDTGITGTVYLAPETVYYSIPDPPADQTGWWDIGELPESLGGDDR